MIGFFVFSIFINVFVFFDKDGNVFNRCFFNIFLIFDLLCFVVIEL